MNWRTPSATRRMSRRPECWKSGYAPELRRSAPRPQPSHFVSLSAIKVRLNFVTSLRPRLLFWSGCDNDLRFVGWNLPDTRRRLGRPHSQPTSTSSCIRPQHQNCSCKVSDHGPESFMPIRDAVERRPCTCVDFDTGRADGGYRLRNRLQFLSIDIFQTG